MNSILYVNDKTFEGEIFLSLMDLVIMLEKSFTVLLNKNKSRFHILKLLRSFSLSKC